MNIAIFTDTYYPDVNSIAVSTKALVDVLKNNGNKVVVITSTIDNKKPSNDPGIYYISFSSKRKRSVFSTINIYSLYFFKEIKNFKPDIIHNQTNGQIGQLGRYTADKLKIPFVYTYHIHYEEYAPYADDKLRHRVFRARERNYFRRMMNISTEFIVPSLKIKNYLRKKGVDKYINVIPTGINPDKFEIDETVKKDYKYITKKFEIADEEKALLYVGTLSKEKNIIFLLNSLEQYVKKSNKYSVKLIVVGEGEQLESLQEKVKELSLDNVVCFAGKVNHEKIKSYYAMANAYVTASTSETQNITIMEAMMCKSLVLAKEDESLIGVIDDGINGFIYSDEDEFIEKLDTILSMSEDKKEKMTKLARKRIVDDYNLDKYYSKVMEVYTRAQRKNW